MKAVVIGSTGLIGKAIAVLLTDQGHEIVQASRTTQPSVDLVDPASINAFYRAIGEVDAILCAAGHRGGGMGSLGELSDAAIESVVSEKLVGQVNLVRHGLASLRPGGVFILTGGMSAYTSLPRMSVGAMVNSGLESFVRHASLDLQDGRRIVIVHPPPIREAVIQNGMDGTRFPNAATVAETYLSALESKITGQPIFVEGYQPLKS
jgi:NAD(P)-dependent dehydrogenase (short-subunit alcohol dehydrogenase family)